jgi:hypothetical protein
VTAATNSASATSNSSQKKANRHKADPASYAGFPSPPWGGGVFSSPQAVLADPNSILN